MRLGRRHELVVAVAALFGASGGGAGDPYSPLIARPTPTGTTYNVSTSDSPSAIKAIYDAAASGDKLAFAAGTYDADAIFTQGFNRPGVIIGPQSIGANDADPFGDGSGVHWARCVRNVIFEYSSIGADGTTITPNVISAADVTIHDIKFKLAAGTWPADGSNFSTTLGASYYDRCGFLVPYSGAHRYKVLYCEFFQGYGAAQDPFDPSLTNSYYDYTAASGANRLIRGPVCIDGRYYKGDSCTIYGNYFHDMTGGFHNIMPGSGTLWIQHNWGERFYHDWSNLLGQSTHTTTPSAYIIEQNIGIDPFSNSADTDNPHQDFDQIQFQHNSGGKKYISGIRSNRNAVFSRETTRGTGIQINFHPLKSGASESITKLVGRGNKYRENFAVMSGSSHGLDTDITEHLYVRGNVIAHLPGLDTTPSLARITWKNGNAYVAAITQKTYKGGNVFEGPTVGSIETFKENDFEIGWVTGRNIPDANIFTGDLTTYPTSLADAFVKLKTKGIYASAGCSAANIREHILAPLDWTGETPYAGVGTVSNATPSTLTTSQMAWVHGGDPGDTHTFTPGAGLEARTLLTSDGVTEVQTWTASPITGVQTDNHLVQIRGNSAAQDGAVQYSYSIDSKALTWDIISTYTPYTTAAFDATGAVAQPSNAGAGSNSKYLTYALEMAVPADVTSAKDIYTVVSGTGTMKIQILSDESLRMYVYNSAGTQILQINTAQKFSIGGASRRVLVSVDTTQATNTDGVKVFFDGVEDTGATLSGWSVNADIGHSRSVRRKLGGAIGFTFGMFWCSNEWVDISNPVERAKFNASNIGSDGSGVTGTQPPIFMWGDVTKLNSASANYGSTSFAFLSATIS